MNILVLEDNDERIKAFRRKFMNHTLDIVKHAQEAIDLIKTKEYHRIYLDHDLGDQQLSWDEEDCGMVVAKYLQEHPVNAHVIIHSFNGYRAQIMHEMLPGSSYTPGCWI